MGALGFLVAVVYWPGILEPSTLPRWLVLAIGLPLVSRLDPRAIAPPIWGQLCAGLIYAAASVFWSPDHGEGLLQFFFLLILALAFVAAAGLESLDGVMTGLALGIGVSSALCVAQLAGWSPIMHLNVPSGLFYNREALAELAAPVAVWAILRRRWWLAVLSGFPLLVCQSRIAVLAAALGLLYAWRAALWAKLTALAFIALAASMSVWADASKVLSAETRIAIWRGAVKSMTLFGRGLGWFWDVSPYQYAHSDVLQAFDELGIGALFFASIPVLIFMRQRGSRDERMVYVTASIILALSFPLHQPAAGFVFAVLSGYLAGVGRDRSVFRYVSPIGDGQIVQRPLFAD